MMVYVATFLVFLITIILMAIGVIFHRRSIQGSCGGLNQVDIERVCNCETTCEEHSRVLYKIQESGTTTMPSES